MRLPTIAALILVASPAAAHEWYTGLKSPESGLGCCNQTDCEPVEACVQPDGKLGVALKGICWPIDPAVVLDLPSPDGLMHACMAPSDKAPRCIILGGGA